MNPYFVKVLTYLLLLMNSEPDAGPEKIVSGMAEVLQVKPDTVYKVDTVYLTETPPVVGPVEYLVFIEGLTDTLKGAVNLEAKTNHGTTQVYFEMKGPGFSKTWTERISPYFFNGDSGGNPTGWNTTEAPNGFYRLLVITDSTQEDFGFYIANTTARPPAVEPPVVQPPVTQPTGGNLFFRAEEVDLWRYRIANGIYVKKGDVSPNSPGDFERIEAGAKRYVANPENDNWYGPTGSGLVQKWATPESKNKGRDLILAAFYALVKEDPGTAQVVRANVLKMVRTKRLDFADRSQWNDNLETINPGFFVPDWGLRIAQSYYYTQGYFSESERAEVETFLKNIAEWSWLTMQGIMKKNWENRLTGVPAGNYKTPNCVDYTGKCRLTWDGGYKVPIFAQYTYNNRSWMFERYLAWAGNQYGVKKWKDEARQFFYEWIKYGVYPGGTMAELYRGPGGYSWSPGNTGYYYAGICLASAIQTAEYFHRAGDSSLYGYSFSQGLYGNYDLYMGTGERSLKIAILEFLSYHTTQKGIKVDGVPMTGHWNNGQNGYVLDGNTAIANKYYRSATIERAYKRTAPGAIPYPANVSSMAGNNGYQGVLGSVPGVALMYY